MYIHTTLIRQQSKALLNLPNPTAKLSSSELTKILKPIHPASYSSLFHS